MIVLCTGMARSGSTWSFNACKGVIESAFPNMTALGLYGESVRTIIETDGGKSDHIVLKCHHVADDGSRTLIERQQCKLIYTYREPCAAAASGIAVFGHSFEFMVATIRQSLEFLDYQRRVGDPLVVSYVELDRSPRRAIRRIADHLDASLNEDAIGEIDRNCSREELGKIATMLESFDPSEVNRDEPSPYHRRTLIHRNHLRQRDAGWRGVLTDQQAEQIREVMRPWSELWAAEGDD